MLGLYMLIGVRDIGSDELADGKRLGPCVRIGGV